MPNLTLDQLRDVLRSNAKFWIDYLDRGLELDDDDRRRLREDWAAVQRLLADGD